MGLNTKYFNVCELTGVERLQEFNSLTDMFAFITPSAPKSQWDASGICNSQRVLIEIKVRNAVLTPNLKASGATFMDDNLFIEDYKLAAILLESKINNFVPIYVNFLADGNVVIFNLEKLTSYKLYSNLSIDSKGYQATQARTNRIGLMLEDATIYSKDGKLIRKNKIDSGKVNSK